jgi:hypothetical protein
VRQVVSLLGMSHAAGLISVIPQALAVNKTVTSEPCYLRTGRPRATAELTRDLPPRNVVERSNGNDFLWSEPGKSAAADHPGCAVTVADTSDAPLARAALSANTNGQFHRSLQRGRSAPKIFEFASLVRVAP